MSVNTAFSAKQGANQNLSATTTSQTANVGKGQNQLRVTCKTGGGDLFIRHYSSTSIDPPPVATTADYCIVAGQSSVFTKPQGHDVIAFITDTGTAAFKVIPGEGI